MITGVGGSSASKNRVTKNTGDIGFFDGDLDGSKSTASNLPEHAVDDAFVPLPTVSNKALQERERRSLRTAQESFTQINQKASAAGQVVFDRLLKACNDVIWRGESVLVLNQIRVDPPYGKDDCKLLMGGSSGVALKEVLERVKMIVDAN